MKTRYPICLAGALLCATASSVFAWSPSTNSTVYGSSLSVSSTEVVTIDNFIFNRTGVNVILDDTRTYSVTKVEVRSPTADGVAAKLSSTNSGATLISDGTIAVGNTLDTSGVIELIAGKMQATTTVGLGTGQNGVGTMTMSGGSFSALSTMAIATGSASTGILRMSGGSLSATLLTLAGGAGNSTGSFTLSGGDATFGNLAFASGNGASSGILSIEGGNLIVTATTTLAKNGTGRLQVLSGSFQTGTLTMGLEGKTSYLTVSSNAVMTVSSGFSAGSSASVTMRLDGATFTPGKAIISLGASNVSLDSGMTLRIDMGDYAATETQTITLMSYDAKPTQTPMVTITGDYDDTLYQVMDAVWGDTSLTVTINYIPEPAAVGAMLGLLALAAVARRRRA